MDGKELLKFLNGIGVPLNCNLNPDSLDVYMKNKSSRSFVVGICRTLSVDNLLHEHECEKEIEMEFSQEEKSSEMVTDMDLDELLASVNDLENHIKSLEQKNVVLKSSLQEKTRYINNTESLAKNLDDKLSNHLSECQELVTQLKNESSLLTQDYTQLYQLISAHNLDPLLLFQLPLHSYKADKQTFENHVKNFIIKQFEERTAELAGQNVMTTCRQQNPRELHHLVSGPEKQVYKQQLIELEQLQICLAESLYMNYIQEAKILGLETGIKKAKQSNENTSRNKNLNTRYGKEDNIAILEERIHGAATDFVSRRLGVMVTGNYKIKQRRQHYYLEKLNMLETLLQHQLALDKLLCVILQIEGSMTEKACNFIQVSQDCMNETANNAIFIVSNMHDCKQRSTWENNSDETTQFDEALLQLLAEFEATKLIHKTSEDGLNDKASIFNARDYLKKMLQNVELQILQKSDGQCDTRVMRIRGAVCEQLLNTTAMNDKMLKSDPQFETFKQQTNKDLTQFYLDMKRQEQCTDLRSLRNLWARFVVHPESLSLD